jgi:hypothetical protein
VARKGKLGRQLKVPPQCYAGHVLGGCLGKVTQEHPLSQGLRKGKTLQVIGNRLPPGAGDWIQTFSESVSAKQASAPLLCEKHNRALSPADNEAKKLSEALRDVRSRWGSLIARPHTISINGHFFGRWLCKYYCGCLTMTGQVPHADFVRYAFGEPTKDRLYFLFPVRDRAASKLGDTKNLPLRVFRTETGDAFHVAFEGLDVIVSTLRGDGPEMQEVYEELEFPNGTQIFARPHGLSIPGVHLRISLDWSSDPQ